MAPPGYTVLKRRLVTHARAAAIEPYLVLELECGHQQVWKPETYSGLPRPLPHAVSCRPCTGPVRRSRRDRIDSHHQQA